MLRLRSNVCRQNAGQSGEIHVTKTFTNVTDATTCEDIQIDLNETVRFEVHMFIRNDVSFVTSFLVLEIL